MKPSDQARARGRLKEFSGKHEDEAGLFALKVGDSAHESLVGLVMIERDLRSMTLVDRVDTVVGSVLWFQDNHLWPEDQEAAEQEELELELVANETRAMEADYNAMNREDVLVVW